MIAQHIYVFENAATRTKKNAESEKQMGHPKLITYLCHHNGIWQSGYTCEYMQ